MLSTTRQAVSSFFTDSVPRVGSTVNVLGSQYGPQVFKGIAELARRHRAAQGVGADGDVVLHPVDLSFTCGM